MNKDEHCEPRLREREAALYLGVTPSLLRKFRRQRGGPLYAKVGAAVVYDRQNLDDFLKSRTVHPLPVGLR